MQAKTNEKSSTFTVKLLLPKQITRGPLRMDAKAPLRYIFIWVIWLFVYQRLFIRSFRFWSGLFLKKWPVLCRWGRHRTIPPQVSCVTGAVFVCFLGQRENYEGAREARCFPRVLCETTQQTNWAYAARVKKPQTPRVGFSVFISCFSLN